MNVSISPGQYVDGPLIIPGAAGGNPKPIIKESGALAPQILFAVTYTFPAVAPAVRIAVVVELVPVHPVPYQVYDVAPLTGTIEKVSTSPGQ